MKDFMLLIFMVLFMIGIPLLFYSGLAVIIVTAIKYLGIV
jgi:hypothetical protein